MNNDNILSTVLQKVGKKVMKIHLYSVCYNEEIILPYYLNHYSKFVDKITVYDNFSTDSSVEILKQNNVEVIPFKVLIIS